MLFYAYTLIKIIDNYHEIIILYKYNIFYLLYIKSIYRKGDFTKIVQYFKHFSKYTV